MKTMSSLRLLRTLAKPRLMTAAVCRPLHSSVVLREEENKPVSQSEFRKVTERRAERSTEMASQTFFQDQKRKNKETFMGALEIFKNRDVRRRGNVEFIYAALKHLQAFGVQHDLEVYKSIIDIMPKGVYVPKNMWQAEFFHYPKQQECLLVVLRTMSENMTIPDEELGEILENTCGKHSAPYRRYLRMRYWLPKFKNLSPWPLPVEMPDDAQVLAKMAIEQITSVDRLTAVTTHQTAEELPVCEEKTWIVSGISPVQKRLLRNLPKKTTIYVEGAYSVWLRGAQVTYFILKGPATRRKKEFTDIDIDDTTKYKIWTHGDVDQESKQNKPPTVHEQEESTIYACCATGTSSKDSLLSWIRILEKEEPHLSHLAVLFTLRKLFSPVVPLQKEELELKPYQ